jgi:hypothetical protein
VKTALFAFHPKSEQYVRSSLVRFNMIETGFPVHSFNNQQIYLIPPILSSLFCTGGGRLLSCPTPPLINGNRSRHRQIYPGIRCHAQKKPLRLFATTMHLYRFATLLHF